MPRPDNPRLRDLAFRSASYLIEQLQSWSNDDIRRAIVHYEAAGSAFDGGIANFLRLYLGTRTVKAVMRDIP